LRAWVKYHARFERHERRQAESDSSALNDLPTERQKRPYRLLRITGEEALRQRILSLSMVVLRKGLDMIPLPVGGVVVSMNRAIHVLPIPMMGESACLHLRPPKIDVAPIGQEQA
jgi:hypothetical protein